MTNIGSLILFILIDKFGLNKLWNENYERRLFHHIQNSNYDKNKIPIIYKIDKLLNIYFMHIINNLKFPITNGLNTKSKLFSILAGGQYSKKSSLYFKSFDKNTQDNLIYIGNIIIPRLEYICGEKLKLANSDFKATILRYEGKDTGFGWHYDNEPNNCYRVLILIKKVGNIPTFQYKSIYNNTESIKLDIGDAILLKGTQTYHRVKESKDMNSIRWILGFQYVSGTYPKNYKSLCTEFRGSNLYGLVKVFVPQILFCIYVQLLSDNFIYIFVPLKVYLRTNILIHLLYLNKNNYKSILIYLVVLYLHFYNIILTLGFSSYILLTESFKI